jgi:hypothetical protein
MADSIDGHDYPKSKKKKKVGQIPRSNDLYHLRGNITKNAHMKYQSHSTFKCYTLR